MVYSDGHESRSEFVSLSEGEADVVASADEGPVESKGERTKRRILETCAALFNEKGYSASMNEVVAETGLPKGSLYFHFRDKEHLTQEALEHALKIAQSRKAFLLDETLSPKTRLTMLLDRMARNWSEPTFPGGSPFLNAAVDSERLHPEARKIACEAFAAWHTKLSKVLVAGVDAGELSADLDVEATATLIISVYEGSMAISRVSESPAPLERALRHLAQHLGIPAPTVPHRISNPFSSAPDQITNDPASTPEVQS